MFSSLLPYFWDSYLTRAGALLTGLPTGPLASASVLGSCTAAHCHAHLLTWILGSRPVCDGRNVKVLPFEPLLQLTVTTSMNSVYPLLFVQLVLQN